MPKTYLLVDLQNQQPEPAHIASWIGDEGEVWLFFGEHELNLLPRYFEIGPQFDRSHLEAREQLPRLPPCVVPWLPSCPKQAALPVRRGRQRSRLRQRY